ncbi:MAG: hypothetical protein H6868_08835 [Rhodospirillales bacterium]|nr:hypothetical protein [Rhodospirillales bacterium]
MPTYDPNNDWQEIGSRNDTPEMGYKPDVDVPDMSGAYGDVTPGLLDIGQTISPTPSRDDEITRKGVIIGSLIPR